MPNIKTIKPQVPIEYVLIMEGARISDPRVCLLPAILCKAYFDGRLGEALKEIEAGKKKCQI